MEWAGKALWEEEERRSSQRRAGWFGLGQRRQGGSLAKEGGQGKAIKMCLEIHYGTYFSKSGAKSAALDSLVKPVTYNVFFGMVDGSEVGWDAEHFF